MYNNNTITTTPTTTENGRSKRREMADFQDPREPTCHACGQRGHVRGDETCTAGPNSHMTCHNCQEKGHAARECPKPRDTSRIRCFRCQETGHFASACPKAEEAGQQNNNGNSEQHQRKSWRDLSDQEKDDRRSRIKQRLQRRWAKSALARLPHRERPARRQAAPPGEGGGPVRPEYTHHSSEYNIWYHKKIGDRFEREERMKAPTRCSIARDAGYTKADMGEGQNARDHAWHCLYFARGHCTKGAQCGYFHRVPEFADSAAIPTTHDVFGRERFKGYRDDMGGVGSFGRNNRTLFIGNFDDEGGVDDDVIRRTFAEFGDLEYARVFWDRCFGFARFACRAQAEFAKECLMDQTFLDLPEGKVLSVRWAHEDPNPAAIENERMNILAEVTQAVAAARAQEEELFEYDEGDDGDSDGDGDGDLDAESKKRLDFFPSTDGDDTAYPNTDARFKTEAPVSASAVIVRDFLKSWVKLPDLGPPSDARSASAAAAAAAAAGPSTRPDERAGERELEALFQRYTTALIAGGAYDAATLGEVCSSASRVQALGIGDVAHAAAVANAAALLRAQLNPSKQAQPAQAAQQQQEQRQAAAGGQKPAEWMWDGNAQQWYYTDASGSAVYYDQTQQQQQQQSAPVASTTASATSRPAVESATTSLVDY
jgi:Torus domain/RNA recognition motif/Zinc knuckle